MSDPQTYKEAMNEWLDIEEAIEVGQERLLTREQRETLKAMSFQAFGSTSRWQTVMRKKHLNIEQIVTVMNETFQARERIKRRISELHNAQGTEGNDRGDETDETRSRRMDDGGSEV